MVILRSALLEKYPEIIFGFSTKISDGSEAPFHFNMSQSVGDEIEKVEKNRELFFGSFNHALHGIQLQRQVHGDTISIITSLKEAEQSDAMITAEMGIGLGVSTADCNAVFLFDPEKFVVAGIHSGWKGTALKIVSKTVEKMKSEFGTEPANLVAYLAPSISGRNYGVGPEVAAQFDGKYITQIEGRSCLDLIKNNYDQLIKNGLINKNIQMTTLCSYEGEKLFHSYRRDGLKSGRALGVIGIKIKDKR